MLQGLEVLIQCLQACWEDRHYMSNAYFPYPPPSCRTLMREASAHRAFYAHPGEVAAAEAEAIAAQRAALRALPASAAKRVEVVASVCTDVPSFLHSQPTLTALAGALSPVSRLRL